MEKRIVEVKICGVPPEIKSEWLVATALADSEEPYNVITVSRTETLLCWVFGVKIILQMTKKDVKRLPGSWKKTECYGEGPFTLVLWMPVSRVFKKGLPPSRAPKS